MFRSKIIYGLLIPVLIVLPACQSDWKQVPTHRIYHPGEMLPGLSPETQAAFVIRTPSECETVLSTLSCDQINFNEYSLIGRFIEAGGCDPPDIQARLLVNRDQTTYRHHLKIILNGECFVLFAGWDLFLVSKIPSNADVIFETQEVYSGLTQVVHILFKLRESWRH